jgi:RNA polymerase sigma-70 factor (ECF subfamily)
MDEQRSDDDLATTAKQDLDTFTVLYRRHLHRVYSYLLSRVGNVSDAQDLTTQTFISALTSIQRYQPQGYFVAWLIGIAKHKLSDHFRERPSVVPIDEIEPLSSHDLRIEDEVIQRLQMEAITLILSQINPDRAEAVRLRFFADLKIREIATVMMKSEGAVKMLLARGLDDIRHILANQEIHS